MYRNTEPFYFKHRSRSQAPCGPGVVESQSPKALAASVLSICRLARFRLSFACNGKGFMSSRECFFRSITAFF